MKTPLQKSQKLLAVAIDRQLIFEDHVSFLCA